MNVKASISIPAQIGWQVQRALVERFDYGAEIVELGSRLEADLGLDEHDLVVAVPDLLEERFGVKVEYDEILRLSKAIDATVADLARWVYKAKAVQGVDGF